MTNRTEVNMTTGEVTIIPLTPQEEIDLQIATDAANAAEVTRVAELADGTFAETNAIAGYDGDLETPVTYKDLKALAQALKDQFPTLDLPTLRNDFIAHRKLLL